MLILTNITLFTIRVINSVMHTVGCYILVRQYRNGKDTPQQAYIINLSLAEALQNFFCSLFVSPGLAQIPDHAAATVDMLQQTIVIIVEISINLVYYVSMIFITFDKFFEIWLNLKYPLYWSVRKAKYLLKATWLVCALACIVCLTAYKLKVFDYYPYIWYIYLSLDVVFVTTATIAYVFIFIKYKQTRQVPAHIAHSHENLTRNNNIFDVFRHSRFYMTVLLISSFIVFKVTPDVLFFIFRVADDREDISVYELDMVVFHSWAISDFLDAWIYIFAQKTVRKMLYRTLTRICGNAIEGLAKKARAISVVTIYTDTP